MTDNRHALWLVAWAARRDRPSTPGAVFGPVQSQCTPLRTARRGICGRCGAVIGAIPAAMTGAVLAVMADLEGVSY